MREFATRDVLAAIMDELMIAENSGYIYILRREYEIADDL